MFNGCTTTRIFCRPDCPPGRRTKLEHRVRFASAHQALAAGYLGHSATLATTEVFDAFLSDDEGKAFMHGPTFMGNPLACAIALKSIEVFQRDDYLARIGTIERILNEHLLPLRSTRIRETRVLGATGVIETFDADDLAGFQEFAISRGVWLRPYERFLYTMPPYVIRDDELLRVVSTMRDWFSLAGKT
ncbi:MAG: aminotransferase class III-fold pyridoxal phosphate-dependent enzyme [Chloroflexi bacterium]|nr:aminotransferase class III-fold pyridoxal phosphate-dependent enzyme [Chloroflexota bacterium]